MQKVQIEIKLPVLNKIGISNLVHCNSPIENMARKTDNNFTLELVYPATQFASRKYDFPSYAECYLAYLEV